MAQLAESNARFIRTMKGKHLQHALNGNKRWWRKRLKDYFGFDVWKLPVCERCEGYALWHKEGDNPVGACLCGHITKNPITVEQYYEQGHHIDKTGLGRNMPVLVDRELIEPKKIATVYGGDAGLIGKDTKKILVARR